MREDTKIIVCDKSDGGYRVFTVSPGGWTENVEPDLPFLASYVERALKEHKLKVKDVLNGHADARIGEEEHYIGCFDAIPEEDFEGLLAKLAS